VSENPVSKFAHTFNLNRYTLDLRVGPNGEATAGDGDVKVGGKPVDPALVSAYRQSISRKRCMVGRFALMEGKMNETKRNDADSP
jgi:hypothetical protein